MSSRAAIWGGQCPARRRWRLLPQGRKKPSEAECLENGGQTKRSIGLTTVRRTSVVITTLTTSLGFAAWLVQVIGSAASLVEELQNVESTRNLNKN